MHIISKIDYKIYKKFDKIAYGLSIILLLAVLVPGLGKVGGGANRWIIIKPLGNLSIQPSEIAKVALVIFFASYLTDNREKLTERKEGFFKPLFLYLAPVVGILLAFQSHLSASVLIIAVVSVMMIMAGSRIRYFLAYGGLGGTFRTTALCIFLLNFFIWENIESQGLLHFWILGPMQVILVGK